MVLHEVKENVYLWKMTENGFAWKICERKWFCMENK